AERTHYETIEWPTVEILPASWKSPADDRVAAQARARYRARCRSCRNQLHDCGTRHRFEREQRRCGETRSGEDQSVGKICDCAERVHGRAAAGLRLAEIDENSERGRGPIFYFGRATQLRGHPGFARDCC